MPSGGPVLVRLLRELCCLCVELRPRERCEQLRLYSHDKSCQTTRVQATRLSSIPWAECPGDSLPTRAQPLSNRLYVFESILFSHCCAYIMYDRCLLCCYFSRALF